MRESDAVLPHVRLPFELAGKQMVIEGAAQVHDPSHLAHAIGGLFRVCGQRRQKPSLQEPWLFTDLSTRATEKRYASVSVSSRSLMLTDQPTLITLETLMDIDDARLLASDLDQMKSLSGSTSKAEFAETWTKSHHQEFLEWVGNTHRQWFVTWTAVQSATPSGGDLPLDEVLYAAEARLATPAQTASRLAAKRAGGWPDNVLKAIVEKTLDAGITVKSILKAQGSVVRFSPSLAADWTKMSDKKRQELLENCRFVSTPKMDGLRCIIKLNTPDEGVYSRSLKPLKNMNRHLEALKRMFRNPCVIDGEALASDGSWNSSMTGSKREGSSVPMLLYPFDYIPADEMASGKYVTKAEERHDILNTTLDYGDESMFVRVEQTPVRSIKDVTEAHRADIMDGWEGSVLHNLDAPYACKRSTAWVKVKAWQSSEFIVSGFVAGRGKHQGRLGTIVIEGTHLGLPIRCEVGTGFSDAQREEIWSDQSRFLHARCEIKFFEATPDGALRFPSFLRFRGLE